MSQRVTADWMGLMGQASATVSTYLQAASGDDIKGQRDKLIYAAICAADFFASTVSVAADKISDGLNNVADAIRSEE